MANLGHRPGNVIQIVTSGESAIQARAPEHRPITTSEVVEARRQRWFNCLFYSWSDAPG